MNDVWMMDDESHPFNANKVSVVIAATLSPPSPPTSSPQPPSSVVSFLHQLQILKTIFVVLLEKGRTDRNILVDVIERHHLGVFEEYRWIWREERERVCVLNNADSDRQDDKW